MYRCNDCGHEFERWHYVNSWIIEHVCPKCNSPHIVELTPEYLREQAELEKADEDYEDEAERKHYGNP